MSNERITPEMPSIVLDKEDREAYQRTRKQPVSAPKTTEKEAPVKKGGSGVVTFFLFILAAGACGASYWLYEQKVAMDKQLASAESRIDDLERRLSATGEELDQSAVALQVKVNELGERSDELWRQMDKLWASAWRRNQSELKALATKVDKDDKSLKQQIGNVENELNLSSTNLAVLQEQLNEQRVQAQDLEILIGELERQGGGINRQFGDIEAKLIAVDQTNSAITRRIAALEQFKKEQERKPVTLPEPQVVNTPVQPTGNGQ